MHVVADNKQQSLAGRAAGAGTDAWFVGNNQFVGLEFDQDSGRSPRLTSMSSISRL